MASGLPTGFMLDSKSDNGEQTSICKVITDWLLFYMTAFFVLLTIFSILSLIFLVPFFIDPAWSTLQADFEPQGILCTTISAEYKEGRMRLTRKKTHRSWPQNGHPYFNPWHDREIWSTCTSSHYELLPLNWPNEAVAISPTGQQSFLWHSFKVASYT